MITKGESNLKCALVCALKNKLQRRSTFVSTFCTVYLIFGPDLAYLKKKNLTKKTPEYNYSGISKIVTKQGPVNEMVY